MTLGSSHAFLLHFSVSGARNLLRDFVLLQITAANDWAALETWLNIQGVHFLCELQDLSLFLLESRPLTNLEVVVYNLSDLSPNAGVSKTGAAFFSKSITPIIHFIIWNLMKRWNAPIPGHLPVAAQSLEITNWCWLFCAVPREDLCLYVASADGIN